MSLKCESCNFFSYDEEYDDYVCDMDLDEDEMARVLSRFMRKFVYRLC